MAASIRIGTSGWHYKHWLGTFYPRRLPASKMLSSYIQHFDTVEVNNTFYGLPPEAGVQAWHDSTPDDFCFAVKGSRFLTHMKKLKDPEPGLEKFFSRVDLLQEKLGPILFQLPPNWPADRERFAAFLKALPKHHRYSFEFRNATWNCPEIYRCLEKYNAALCIFDLAGYQSLMEITADFSYIRLHEPGGKYQGSYDSSALSRWADWIRHWRAKLKGIYVYFDNDQAGYAAHNAMRLKEITGPST